MRQDYIKTKASNQPGSDPHVAEAMKLISQAVTKAKAVTLLKLLPFLPPEKQTVRALAEILGVSRQTVWNWINFYGSDVLKERG